MSNLFTSSIGKKLIMSITGIFLILFLLFHMSMNLVAVFSPVVYNVICEALGANWYAVIGTGILAAGFIIHILYSLTLTLQNRKARGQEQYAKSYRSKEVEWASKNMFVLGVVILAFLAIHLYNFWYKMQFVELTHIQTSEFSPTDGAGLIYDLFSNPVYVLIYLIAFVALWFHLTHGFWSAFQSIGFNNKNWLKRMRIISNAVATIFFLGFSFVVVYAYLHSHFA